MPGYVCIAMLEDPPYNLYLAATEEEPEEWCADLPLASHLLCYEGFIDPQAIQKQCVKQLKADGIEVKSGKAFAAQPHEVIRVFMSARDEALKNNQVVKNFDSSNDDEGGRLYDLAREHEEGSDQVVPDIKKAFKLFQQSADLSYSPAYFSLALAYLNGDGIKKDLNESLKWARRCIESGSVYGYEVAADCFVEAGMKEQASEMWLRCFRENDATKVEGVIFRYAYHASKGDVEIVHTEEIARLFGEVANRNKERAIKYPHLRQVVDWLRKKQVVDEPDIQDIGDLSDDTKKAINLAVKYAKKAGSMYGFQHATESLLRANLSKDAEYVWRYYFNLIKSLDDPVLLISCSDIHPYKNQVENKCITPVHTRDDVKYIFGLAKQVKEKNDDFMMVSYKNFIEWLAKVQPAA
ncbi:MAG: tetratricopeptide repeat protein [Methylococcaceae bacterium]|nr:tetratricopeptide repeat protein [Methylococcaceae bacterium]